MGSRVAAAAFAVASATPVVAGFVVLVGMVVVGFDVAAVAFARVLANLHERATLSVGMQPVDCLLVC